MAIVYLIHLDQPIHHARHYLGYTAKDSVQDRLATHKQGNGARLLNAANKRGIDYNVVRTWECKDWRQARRLEKRLKSRHNAPRMCPVCNLGVEL